MLGAAAAHPTGEELSLRSHINLLNASFHLFNFSELSFFNRLIVAATFMCRVCDAQYYATV